MIIHRTNGLALEAPPEAQPQTSNQPMITFNQLSEVHRHTYRKIFSNPISTNVRRVDMRALLESLGRVANHPESKRLIISRNGHTLVLLSPGPKDTETKEALIALQHFLIRSENPSHHSNGRDAHLLLVIGHHQSRIFRSEVNGGHPMHLMPHEQKDCFRSSRSLERKSDSDIPSANDPEFFEPIAQELQCSGEILVFGESSETPHGMDRFIAWLKRQHPELANRIVGSLVLDKDQADSESLLATARKFYANCLPL